MQPSLEALEPRRCLSAVLVEGIVWVRGSQRGDVIRIADSYDDATGSLSIRVTQNNRKWNFPGDAVRRFNIDARAGDDDVTNTTGIHCRIIGGLGNDHIIGGSGNDILIGGAGDDALNGWDGGDRLVGGAGADALDGWAGGDRLLGGPGDDSLDGGDDRDALYGGGGNDHLIGGDGGDYMDGGAGDDYFDSRDCRTDDSISGGLGQDVEVIDGFRDFIVYVHDHTRDVESTSINEACSR